jgi:hypothetical protein
MDEEVGLKYLVLEQALETIVSTATEPLGFSHEKCTHCGVSVPVKKRNLISHLSGCPALIAFNALNKVKHG